MSPVQETLGTLYDATSKAVDRTRGSLDSARSIVQDRAGQTASQAVAAGEEVLALLSQRIRDQPLAAAAVALGIGYGLALLLHPRR